MEGRVSPREDCLLLILTYHTMARSTCIYLIVHDVADAENPVFAAFTVKHECLTWLENCKSPYKSELVIQRFRDNPRGEIYRDEPKPL